MTFLGSHAADSLAKSAIYPSGVLSPCIWSLLPVGDAALSAGEARLGSAGMEVDEARESRFSAAVAQGKRGGLLLTFPFHGRRTHLLELLFLPGEAFTLTQQRRSDEESFSTPDRRPPLAALPSRNSVRSDMDSIMITGSSTGPRDLGTHSGPAQQSKLQSRCACIGTIQASAICTNPLDCRAARRPQRS